MAPRHFGIVDYSYRYNLWDIQLRMKIRWDCQCHLLKNILMQKLSVNAVDGEQQEQEVDSTVFCLTAGPVMEDWDIISPKDVIGSEQLLAERTKSLASAALPFTQSLLSQVPSPSLTALIQSHLHLTGSVLYVPV